MTPKQRFALWVLCVVVAVLVPAAIGLSQPQAIRAAAAANLGALVGLAMLLRTTPEDAIILPTQVSVFILLGGAALLSWSWGGSVVPAAAIAAGSMIALAALHQRLWWAALVAWNPVWILI